MSIVAEDFFFASRVEAWEGINTAENVVYFFDQTLRMAAAAQALQSITQGIGDRLGERFARFFGEFAGEMLCFGIFDADWQV